MTASRDPCDVSALRVALDLEPRGGFPGHDEPLHTLSPLMSGDTYTDAEVADRIWLIANILHDAYNHTKRTGDPLGRRAWGSVVDAAYAAHDDLIRATIYLTHPTGK